MTADEAARIILRCEQGCDIPGVQPKPWHIHAAIAILGRQAPGWQIPGTIWFWPVDTDHEPGAWWTAFNRQLRQASTRGIGASCTAPRTASRTSYSP